METKTEQPAVDVSTAPNGQIAARPRGLNRLTGRIWLPPGAILRPKGGALSVPEFRWFWYGSIVSNVGSWMQMVAMGWLILELTNSPFYLGLIGLVRAVPALSITLIGGVVADRVDRRGLLIVTQSAAGVLAVILGVLDFSGVITIGQLLAIAFVSSVVMAFDNPARQALVPDLVGTENVASAIGLNSAAWNSAAIIGPSIAGVLVAAISTAGAFFLNGVSYFAVVYALWKIRPRPPRPRGPQSMFQNLRAGLSFIRQDRRIWGLIVILTVPTFFGRPYTQMMPIFAQNVLHVGAGGYGVLMAATGVGALAGALMVGKLGASSKKGYYLLILTAIFGVSLFGFALSRWFIPSLLVLVVTGGAATLFMSLTNTLLQLNVPEEMRGRVMSVYTLVPMGMMPLGSMAIGTVGDVAGVPLTVAVGAVLILCFTLVAFRLFPAVRRMP
ncbi:MAG TPA: MFS transporter [Thermomicrobiaceae bacterium]|nr:MFS transporter [Thermomicrobiaceae bacterium]